MNDIISIQVPIGNASQFVQEDLKTISQSYDVEEVNDAIANIQKIVDQLIRNDNSNANSTSSDYHNLAVDIARSELYGISCDILEAGLTKYKTCDLLADFLAYGIKCGRIDRCNEIYKILTKMPKIKWNWRGYSFSISYLKFLFQNAETQKEIDKIVSQMKGIVSDFYQYIPNDEEAHICDAEIAELCHEYDKEEQILLNALDVFDIAPKAALRLGDIYANKGKYKDAIKMINRSINDSNQTQASVSEPYLYYLRALCEISIVEREPESISEKTIIDIYSDFNLSLKQERRNGYRKQMRNKALMLEEKTGITIPEKYEELIDLVQS